MLIVKIIVYWLNKIYIELYLYYVYYLDIFNGSGTFRRCRFSAADSAADISAPGLSGARTFFLDLLFCSYVVSVCSSLRSR